MAVRVETVPVSKGAMPGRISQKKLRVAAYCRVSTGEESQQSSFVTQQAFYRELIEGNPSWEFAGIYADEDMSGTSRQRRAGFNRMLQDAKAGRIDYILTKSISRFARNTVDTLKCTQELRNLTPPVGIYFEKENMNTLDRKYDVVLTILAALAQNESYSISENICWGLQKKFQAGMPQINLKRMMGYDRGSNGEWIVNQEQAGIVRFIYGQYLNGRSAHGIASDLNARGIATVNGKKWCTTGILCILENEKYVGDLLMQKTYTRDFLDHRPVENCGERQRYYIRNHHEAIITRKNWATVQKKICERARKRKDYNMVQRFLLMEAGKQEKEAGETPDRAEKARYENHGLKK